MDLQPIRYALLRDRRSWEGERNGLQIEPDGALALARVPGPADGQPVILPGPYETQPSGLALGPCRELYVLDGEAALLIALDEICKSRRILPGCGGPGDGPGELRAPRALLLIGDDLFLADAGNGRVLRYRLPTLDLVAIWGPPLLVAPIGLAADSQGRIYVLDAAPPRVLRFSAWGTPDSTFNSTLAGAGLSTPAFPAIVGEMLYVSDASANSVLCFDLAGNPSGALPAGGPTHPRALASHGAQLYIADAGDGQIWIFDTAGEGWIGTVAGYQGPVAAMALDSAGNLLVKPGQSEALIQLAAGAGCVAAGWISAGPLDAGLDAGWGRVVARAERDGPIQLHLRLYTADAPDMPPAAPDWLDVASLDALAPRAEPAIDPLDSALALGLVPRRGLRPRRYLWLRIELASLDRRASPRLLQAQAETAGQGYLAHLPAIYRRPDDAAQVDFLHDWLELVRSVLGDLGALLDAMPQRFDRAVTPDDHLAWLASWMAFDPPAGADADRLRDLLAALPGLYARRGTPAGLRELIRMYTNAQVQVIEAFQERRIWQLGVTSALGFDTALAPALPDGIIVSDAAAPLVVGDFPVGRAVPLAADELGAPLFDHTAFQFSVIVPAGALPQPAQREQLRLVIERERPAYVDYHLCFVEPRMRVGLQARIGVDSIVAGPPEPRSLEGALLGVETVLDDADADTRPGRIGKRARVGRDSYVA